MGVVTSGPARALCYSVFQMSHYSVRCSVRIDCTSNWIDIARFSVKI